MSGPRAKAPMKTMMPLMQLERTVLPPLVVLSVERVNEPEAGIPEKKAQAMLDIPIENIAWLASRRLPVLAASDLPIEIPSRIQSRAMASAGLASN